ncbi:MAG: PQQ-binding-like beta-propeller repeat protein [Lentisphaeria bacterium]|nr:PQQ-binding-like beta-propeller repeat protein [Lentisphaeria bacterium]
MDNQRGRKGWMGICLGVLGASLAGAAVAADWLQFRGPGGQGVAEAEGLPTRWSDSENLRWTTPLPGPGSSTPIAVGNRLFLTCFSGYGTGGQGGERMEDLRLHVLSLDLQNGGILWNTTIPPRLPESTRVRDHGYAAPTPASDGKHLFVFFGKTGLFKLDLEGKRMWEADVGSGIHGWGCGTSPVLHKGLVLVNASVESGSLVAVHQETGKEVWRAGGMKESWNTPHIVALEGGRTEVVVSVKGAVLAFDPETGRQLWRCRGVQDYVCPSIVSRDGVVYVIGGRKSQALAIRAGGTGDVTGTHLLWEAPVGANVSSPVIVGDALYWVSDRNTTAYCLGLADGTIRYAEKFPGQPYASVLAADGKLYVVTRTGGTVVLGATPRYEVLAHNRLQDRSQFQASPIVAGDCLILRSDRAVYCIGNTP